MSKLLLLESAWLTHPTMTWVTAVLIGLAGYLLAHSVAILLRNRLTALAKRFPNSSAEVGAMVADATRGWLLLPLALALAIRSLELPASIHWHLGQLIYLLVGLQVALWMTRFLVVVLGRLTHRPDIPQNPVIFGIIRWSLQLLVWVILMLAVLGNAGVNVDAFIASLGVGGVAVALAAQNILGDLFASISIGLDKPFAVGEYIAFGNDQGTVTKVGIKSTRIRSISGEELAISNRNLLDQLTHNYARMVERRISFNLRITNDTPRQTAEELVIRARGLIQENPQVRFDRGHLLRFGDYSLDYEFVYFVLDPSYAVYCDVQEEINLKLLQLLEELGIRMAVPVRSIREP